MRHVKTFEFFDSIKKSIKDKKSYNNIVDSLLNSELDETKITYLPYEYGTLSQRVHWNDAESYFYEEGDRLYKVRKRENLNSVKIYSLVIADVDIDKEKLADLGLDKLIPASQSKLKKLFNKLKDTYESYQKILAKYNL